MCGRLFAATDSCTASSATRGIAACAAKFRYVASSIGNHSFFQLIDCIDKDILGPKTPPLAQSTYNRFVEGLVLFDCASLTQSHLKGEEAERCLIPSKCPVTWVTSSQTTWPITRADDCPRRVWRQHEFCFHFAKRLELLHPVTMEVRRRPVVKGVDHYHVREVGPRRL